VGPATVAPHPKAREPKHRLLQWEGTYACSELFYFPA
jgi:hypothetical protein